jgi:hypothetical protein
MSTAGDDDLGLDLDVLAAMLRADQTEAADLLGHLAKMLGGALPDLTTVEHSGGLFSQKKVQRVSVEIADTHFSITRERRGPVAQKHKIVRGVRLSTRETPVDQWIRELCVEITRLAETSATAKTALERLLLGGI